MLNQVESKKMACKCIEIIMNENDIQIKDLTEYLLYKSIDKHQKENPFIGVNKIEENNTKNKMDIQFGQVKMDDIKKEENEGPFNKIEKITKQDEINEKKKYNMFTFSSKSWADSDDEDDYEEPKKIINEEEQPKIVDDKPKNWGDYEDDQEEMSFVQVVRGKKKENTKYEKKEYNYSKQYKKNKLTQEIINNRININSVEEYIDCLKNNKKPCKFGYNCTKKRCNYVHINKDAECDYTYTGKLCPDVRSCGKIHQKRCVYDIDCINNSCSYKHSSDMPTSDAKQAYIDSMIDYENIVMKNFNKRE